MAEITMTRAELAAHEHKLQTGETDVLPDGRTIAEVFAENQKLQAAQEAEILANGELEFPSTDGEYDNQKLLVTVSDSGAISARPIVEDEAKPIVEEEAKPKNGKKKSDESTVVEVQ
jgi:hypothetical protein